MAHGNSVAFWLRAAVRGLRRCHGRPPACVDAAQRSARPCLVPHVCRSWVPAPNRDVRPDYYTTADRGFAVRLGRSAKSDLRSAKAFAERGARQRAPGKETLGKGSFTERLLSGARQSLYRAPQGPSAKKSDGHDRYAP